LRATAFPVLCVILCRLAAPDIYLPSSELDALHTLYNSTDGVHWNWRSVETAGNIWVFNSSANPCTDHWQGVTCFIRENQYHIQRLELPDYALHGAIPPAIGNLTGLEALLLDRNTLVEQVPDTVGQLLGLMELSLPSNELTGELPQSLEYLSALVSLDVGENNLEGTFPSAWQSLTSLVSLSLNGNRFQGTLPVTLGELTRLTTLALYNNEFSGPLPASVGDMRALQFLHLDDNSFTGTLPGTLSQLRHLSELNVGNNQLRGTVPAFLGSLTNLTVLDLHLNGFSKSLPAELGSLTKLQQLRVLENKLTGTIPGTYGQLTALKVLDLSSNHFNGSIPSFAGSWTKLTTLLLYFNDFTGPVPAALGQLTKLTIMDVDGNQLSGTLPDALQSWVHMAILSFWSNALSGTIPTWFCTLKNLTSVYFQSNLFEGAPLSCLDAMSRLEYATFAHNSLTGTVPVMNCSISKLRTVWLQYNQLTGTIPAYGTECGLTQLALSDNQLTGPIPLSLGSPSTVQAISVLHNLLTGTLPAYLGDFKKMQILSVHDNLLTGCVPSTVSNLTGLVEIYLHSNYFSCSLDGVFNPAAQLVLSDIDVSDNHLTGTLPPEIFQLPALAMFVALSNCLSGTLPEQTICANERIVSLIMDGLHTASTCRTLVFPPLPSYVVPTAFHGTIPECFFSMHRLSTLHLSGNSLSGTIPSFKNLSAGLIDLILSHNALTGTIPASVQAHNWRALDLSYNRLTGTLKPDFGKDFAATSVLVGNVTYNVSTASVALENNRLSGRIPSALVHLQTISILGSNLFSCKLDKSDLPVKDQDREAYQCGSTAFDAPFYVVLILVGLACVLVLLCRRYQQVFAALRRLWEQWQLRAADLPHSIAQVQTALDIITQCAVLCTAVILLVLVPWYAFASTNYSTYLYTYAWSVSAAFMSGVTPLAVEMVLYCGLMVAVMVFSSTRACKLKNSDDTGMSGAERESGPSAAGNSISESSRSSRAQTNVPRWKRGLVYVAYMTVNVCVVAGVNAGFVAIALTQSSGVLFLAQLLLSAFKLAWTTVCTPFLIYVTTGYVSRTQASVSFVTVQVFIGLFNNIAIPCLVTAVLSPSCFYSVFDAPEPVESTFAARNCVVEPILIDCHYSSAIDVTEFVPFDILETSYHPPFRYDFQCSSSFITYYAPAFVYLGIAAGVLTPLAKVLGVWLFKRASPHTWWHYVLHKSLPRIIKPVRQPAAQGEDSITSAAGGTTSLSVVALWSHYNPLFDGNNQLITQITYLGILLIYGVVFPPLAVVMCATIISVAWQTKLSLGRFLRSAREVNMQQVSVVEQECRGAISVIKLKRSMFTVVVVCCWFYTLFLFDTLGDAVSIGAAYWVLIVMPLMPVCLYALTYVRVDGAHVAKEAPVHVMSSDGGVGSRLEMKTILAARPAAGKDSDGAADRRSNGSSASHVGESDAVWTRNVLQEQARGSQQREEL
jgi:Leucine-rich repeat (LRR) protein